MTSTSANVAVLTDAQLEELLGLAKDVDSVELKLTLPASRHQSATAALGIDQVFYFDTPDLALFWRAPDEDKDDAGVLFPGSRLQSWLSAASSLPTVGLRSRATNDHDE